MHIRVFMHMQVCACTYGCVHACSCMIVCLLEHNWIGMLVLAVDRGETPCHARLCSQHVGMDRLLVLS